MTQENQPEPMQGRWWMLFPLRGLDVIDEHPNLKKPVFGDATIISKSHIREIVQSAKFNEAMAPEHDHEKDIIFMIEHATLEEEYQALVAVRRSGKLGHGFTESSKTLYRAHSRASQISATLALIFLAVNESGLTCGLVEQIHHKTQSIAALDISQKQFMVSIGLGGSPPRTIRDSKRNIQFSTSQLKDILKNTEFGSLALILLPHKSRCAKSIRRALSASVCRLSDAIHSPNTATQLLGAVTAIEILLSESGDSYDDIIKRLAALLGKQALDSFSVQEIFQARHLYVHKGEEPEMLSSIGSKSIGLALNVIFRYSDLALQFSTKQYIIDYLGLIDKAYHIQEDLGSQAIAKILKHTPNYKVPPFLQIKFGNGTLNSH